MERAEFRERLLGVMERKQHWAWPSFTSGSVSKELLHIHFEQEYETYVRDFPVMVGWAYVQCPIAEVRRALAENLFEEETGGLVAGRPHPELFLEYPKGLGFDLSRFAHVTLLPEAARYRRELDVLLQTQGWAVAAAVATVFIEGTANERAEIEGTARPPKPLTEHPLVLHYGLALEHLALTKAHRAVEGEHRHAAWQTLLEHVSESDHERVLSGVETALRHWLDYRDAVAIACGLSRP